MSINVTVTGNPVNIKRGKMVTTNPYDEKQEYQKRKLMRLEQVRQQSKDFARDVRNKVIEEKNKQLGQIEKEGKEKLKSWQNRRLLDLQTQYREALDEIGMGHKAAKELEDENEIMENQKTQNDLVAQARGKVAAVKSQIEKNEENYKKALPLQQKKIVRDIEKNRAALVSNLATQKNIRKCCKKRKQVKSTGINITVPESPMQSTEESTSSSRSLPEVEDNGSECWEDCSCSDDSDIEETSNGSSELPHKFVKSGRGISKTEERLQDPPSQRRPLIDHTSYLQSVDNRRKLIEDFQSRNVDFPRESRISDRIKQRELRASEPDFCDFANASKVETVSAVPYNQKSPKKKNATLRKYVIPKENLDPELEDVCECVHYHITCPCKRKSSSEPFKNISVQTDQYPSKDKCTCNQHQPSCPKAPKVATKSFSDQVGSDHNVLSVGTTVKPSKMLPTTQKYIEVPKKPSIGLKGIDKGDQMIKSTKSVQVPVLEADKSKTTTTFLPETQKMNYYDHPNRYQGTLPSTCTVERIGQESLEALPNTVSEAEWHEKIRQRDREADIRGKKAMEKELIHRDYEAMMKKLPLLQRKEHIAEIGRDKPEYHMSEERLKELEKNKQLRLENAFTKAFPDLKPATVTLPSINRAAPINSNEPFEILNSGDPRIKNSGKWETDFEAPQMFTVKEVQEIIRSFTGQKREDRYSKLKQLLKSLKMQKEQLIKELRALPKDDSVNVLLEDLNSVSDSDEGKRFKPKRRNKDENRKRKHLSGSEKKDKRKHTNSSDPSSSSGSQNKDIGKSKASGDKERPLRKSKSKRQKMLVLQNTSTQTTPKKSKDKPSTSFHGSEQNLEVSALKICNKMHTQCDCKTLKGFGSSEELCQIVIKLQENEQPKIEVVNKSDVAKKVQEKSKDKESKKDSLDRLDKKEEISLESSAKTEISNLPSKNTERNNKKIARKVDSNAVAPNSEIFKKPLPKVQTTTRKYKSSKDSSRQECWKDHLSKNSISTSSTSYYSPPDFAKFYKNPASSDSFYNLRQKPKQSNISTTLNGDTENYKTIKYIDKLLSMSKASVDDLQVSSSDVQTPSQSIIEMESNNPLSQLHNIVKLINLKASEVAKELSLSTDANTSAVPPNSLVNITDDSQNKSNKTLETSGRSQSHPEKDSNGSSRKSRDSLLHQYTNVTDSCTKRIANLASMIEKIREEKMQMVKDSSVKPETIKDFSTTAYLDLPQSEKSNESNSTVTSMDEEEVNRRLLEIDVNLAEKLRKFSQERQARAQRDQISEESKNAERCEPPRTNPIDSRDEFSERLQKLLEKTPEIPQLPEFPSNLENLPDTQKIQRIESKPFVPLLLNIPQLPILGPIPDVVEERVSLHKHPPPSKGITSIKRINGNISVVPHELSTILEADSVLSTKFSPNTTNNSKLSISPTKEHVTLSKEQLNHLDDVPPLVVPDKTLQSHYDTSSKNEQPKSGPSTKTESSISIACTDTTCSNLSSTASKTSMSTSSSDDLKVLEAMCKSIGMDWAIPALQKTQEAFALSSGSSSPNVSSPRKQIKSSSDISLKKFLTKQMMSKISSSSMKSESSPASFLQEMSDISAINSSSGSKVGKQRTSTPLGGSKATSKSKDSNIQFFTGASDISSVKESPKKPLKSQKPEEEIFRSLSESSKSTSSSSS